MKDFQIPSYRQRVKSPDNLRKKNDNCPDEKPGDLFDGMPMYRPLNDCELKLFKDKILSKYNMVSRIYQQPGLARKVRLSNDYVHTNSRSINSKGLRCILCHYILKEKSGTSTTKGCETCCVPLCSANSYKFKKPEDSCEYRWHNTLDLKSLQPVEKNQRQKPKEEENKNRPITESEQGAIESLMTLSTPRRSPRKRKR